MYLINLDGKFCEVSSESKAFPCEPYEKKENLIGCSCLSGKSNDYNFMLFNELIKSLIQTCAIRNIKLSCNLYLSPLQ